MSLHKKIGVLYTMLLLISSCVTLENEDLILERSRVDYNLAYNQEENLQVKEVKTHYYGQKKILLLYSFEQEREVDFKHFFTDMWDIAFELEQYEGGSQTINIFYNSKSEYFSNHFDTGYPIGFKGNTTYYITGKGFHEVGIAQDSHDAIGKVGDYYVKTKIETPSDYETLINLLPNRTFVIKTTKGNYVKMELQALHKNQPETITLDSEYFYLTFRYFIQRDGSRDLLTK